MSISNFINDPLNIFPKNVKKVIYVIIILYYIISIIRYFWKTAKIAKKLM